MKLTEEHGRMIVDEVERLLGNPSIARGEVYLDPQFNTLAKAVVYRLNDVGGTIRIDLKGLR